MSLSRIVKARVLASILKQQLRWSTHQPEWKAATKHRGLTEMDFQSIDAWPDKNDKRGWTYRQPVDIKDVPRVDMNIATYLSALTIFWVIYNLYWEWGMLFGEFVIPYPHMFTDKELGIPPDDVDEIGLREAE